MLESSWIAPREWMTNYNGWVMLLDTNGSVRDFVAWGWTAPQVATMNTSVQGFPIKGRNLWFGPRLLPITNGVLARWRSIDTDRSDDFTQYQNGYPQFPISTNFSVPFLPYASESPLPVDPPATAPFAAGVWSGNITVHDVASPAILRATWADRANDSNPFVLAPDPDQDHDGLLDAWELAEFGSLSRDGSADYDGDGMSDAGEHEAGTSPTNASAVLRATNVLANISGSDISFSWPTVSGRFYSVFWKSNLLNDLEWLPDPASVDIPGSGTPLTFSNAPAPDPHRYYRIGVRRITN